jgi:hypothetical protein
LIGGREESDETMDRENVAFVEEKKHAEKRRMTSNTFLA